MKHFLMMAAAVMLWACGCAPRSSSAADLQTALCGYVAGKDANIGIGVIIDGRDTVSVNGAREFPMLSVYKFPIALALAEHCRQNNLPFDFPIAILPEDLHPDTYSPMTEKLLSAGKVMHDTVMMPTSELLGYMLQQSDNNASDIVLRGLQGVETVERYLLRLGVKDVHVSNSEAEMHSDNSLCYKNFATPIGMAVLMDKFDREFNDSISGGVKHLMETCQTGTARLALPLANTDARIGHKTGTGFTLPNGRLMAVNDAGYVNLPNGRRYSIAVFIENSGYTMEQTEAMIAEISEIVYKALTYGY